MRYVLFLALTWPTWGLADESKEEKPLPPSEAAKHENEKVSVEMLVRASKNALARRMEIYLDSETDFRDPKNLAIVINQAAADKFKAEGIDDPAAHFKDKIIRVTGIVTLQEKRPRIIVEDPKEIRVVEKK